jgi:hypothetical protein
MAYAWHIFFDILFFLLIDQKRWTCGKRELSNQLSMEMKTLLTVKTNADTALSRIQNSNEVLKRNPNIFLVAGHFKLCP